MPEESRLDSYKKGTFLEKAERFPFDKRIEDFTETKEVFKPTAKPSNVTNLIHLQSQIEQLQGQNSKILKEHQEALRRLEDKLSQNDSTIKSLVKDNVALQRQVTAQQKESRLLKEREMALMATLDKINVESRTDSERSNKLVSLQRRIADLEKTHTEDKKRHQTEIDRLKAELDSRRKAQAEDTDRLANLRKQSELSESKVKELKRVILADQAEIKDLRSKLQSADQTKTQAASRQEEVERQKRTIQQLESKHKQELANRDMKIAQQEKALAADTRRKDAVDNRIGDIKSKAEAQLKDAKDRIAKLQEDIKVLLRTKQEAEQLTSQQQDQLSNVRHTLSRCVEAYGHLASNCTSSELYRQSQLTCVSLELRNLRLDRRLADREAVIEQLTGYCRQTSEENALLRSLLQDADEDIKDLRQAREPVEAHEPEDDMSLILDVMHTWHNLTEDRISVANLVNRLGHDLQTLHREQIHHLLGSYHVAVKESIMYHSMANYLSGRVSEVLEEANNFRDGKMVAETELAKKIVETAESNAREEVLKQRLAVQEKEIGEVLRSLKKEKEQSANLYQSWYKSRKNEEHFQMEIERLTEELQEVTRYKEAHADLLSEVINLIQRNELAEAEAEHLSRFNAEILSHQNPQQKIFYVDRIRQELAEAKHLLLKSTRDKDDLVADNTALLNEVAAYKSIAIPSELKPATSRVRIERAPLQSRNMNGAVHGITLKVTPPQSSSSKDSVTSQMTLEEIM